MTTPHRACLRAGDDARPTAGRARHDAEALRPDDEADHKGNSAQDMLDAGVLNDVGRKFEDPVPFPLRRLPRPLGPLHEFRGQHCLSRSSQSGCCRSAAAASSIASHRRRKRSRDLIRAGNREAVLAAITSPDLDVECEGARRLHRAAVGDVQGRSRAGARAAEGRREGQRHQQLRLRRRSPKRSSWAIVELVRMLLDAGADAELTQSGQPDRAHAGLQHRLAEDRGAADRPRRGRERGGNLPRPDRADVGGGGKSCRTSSTCCSPRRADVKLRAKYDDWPRQMTSEPRAQFRPDRRPHRPALRDSLRLLSLRRRHREGRRRRQSAEPGWHHAADQRARQPQLRHRDVPARQGREPARVGHERPHASLCRGGHELLQRAQWRRQRQLPGLWRVRGRGARRRTRPRRWMSSIGCSTWASIPITSSRACAPTATAGAASPTT